jgi:hypothetical protein
VSASRKELDALATAYHQACADKGVFAGGPVQIAADAYIHALEQKLARPLRPPAERNDR